MTDVSLREQVERADALTRWRRRLDSLMNVVGLLAEQAANGTLVGMGVARINNCRGLVGNFYARLVVMPSDYFGAGVREEMLDDLLVMQEVLIHVANDWNEANAAEAEDGAEPAPEDAQAETAEAQTVH